MQMWEAVYLAKNLKGFYLPPEDDPAADVPFLKKRFRYRRVGILTPHAGSTRVSKPLYPVDPDEMAVPVEYAGLPTALAPLVALASLFMVPVLASPARREELQPLLEWSIRLPRTLTPAELRFNLRLLTYIPIDAAPKHATLVRGKQRKEPWADAVEERAETLRQDAHKRFWRLRDEAGEGPCRLGIVHAMRFARKRPATEEDLAFLLPVGVLFLEE